RLFCCALVLLMTGCSTRNNYPESGNTIEGDNHSVKLLKYTGQQTYLVVDSTEMKDGKFKLKGAAAQPANAVQSVGYQSDSCGFWLENSRIYLTANADSISRARLLGSAANRESEAIRKFLEPYDRNCRQLSQEAGRPENTDKKAWMERQLDSCWKS